MELLPSSKKFKRFFIDLIVVGNCVLVDATVLYSVQYTSDLIVVAFAWHDFEISSFLQLTLWKLFGYGSHRFRIPSYFEPKIQDYAVNLQLR